VTDPEEDLQIVYTRGLDSEELEELIQWMIDQELISGNYLNKYLDAALTHRIQKWKINLRGPKIKLAIYAKLKWG